MSAFENVSYLDKKKNDNFENGIRFNLIFFVRATIYRHVFFFSAASQVINNVKNLPVNILSPIFTVTNYNKKKYCIS